MSNLNLWLAIIAFIFVVLYKSGIVNIPLTKSSISDFLSWQFSRCSYEQHLTNKKVFNSYIEFLGKLYNQYWDKPYIIAKINDCYKNVDLDDKHFYTEFTKKLKIVAESIQEDCDEIEVLLRMASIKLNPE